MTSAPAVQCPKAIRSFVLKSAVAGLGFVAACGAHAATLYDGSLGSSPVDQGWTSSSFPTPFSNYETVEPNAVRLDTTGNNGYYAGYARNETLDRAQGYDLSFTLQMLSESHANADRAGFSTLVVGNDLKGIELGFWGDHVWAQNDSPQFTHSEDAAFDTASNAVLYRLNVADNQYKLYANANQILAGALRDYSATVPLPGIPNPYVVPNTIVLGDRTAFAQANVRLSQVNLTVPEPASVSLLLGGAVMLCLHRPSRKRAVRATAARAV